MNSPIEQRLRDALTEAGARVEPETIRPLRVPARRRSWADVRLLTAAAVVIAGATTALALGLSGGEDRVVAANPEPSRADLSVFLCWKPADTHSKFCQGTSVTSEQKQAIELRLRSMPEVAVAVFEDRQTAYENFRRTNAGNEALLATVSAGDLPESFRLKIHDGADKKRMMTELQGLPGVAQVIDPAEIDSMSEPRLNISAFLCSRQNTTPACRAERPASDGSAEAAATGQAPTTAQIKALTTKIRAMPEVESWHFEDQKAAYEKFKRINGDNPSLMKAIRVSDMPQSFRLILKLGADRGSVVEQLRGLAGVAEVVDQKCMYERIEPLMLFGLDREDPTAC
ncbi:hypothetical protein HII36_02430 [Nonomuraea sp. NN258]|uniref:permease-like cell division protein FtsX n=1 Tax=Nonomuraea antri TaxID=2730852 RepID=UPI00156918A2|nr:permease-like cell division protein FtsX [Nonomuraea antri]NRQ30696.1 hypothetical protein [Nonomuraea antri]